MEKEGGPYLEDFSIGAPTQPLQQVVVVPGVPIKDVRVHEVHSWGLELGLRPGASRASGLKRWHLPPSPQTLHPPCLALPPPAVASPFPTLASCPSQAVQRAPPTVPWALRAFDGQLALGPRGHPLHFQGSGFNVNQMQTI